MEYVFRRTNIKMTFIRPKQGAGKSSSGVLKCVKKEVSPENCGVQIKNIRKNNNGDVVLSINGENHKAEKLKDAILVKPASHSS